MRTDLADLLDAAVPEPARHPSPDAVLHLARGSRRRRAGSASLAALAMAGAAAAAVLALPPSPLRPSHDNRNPADSVGTRLQISALDDLARLVPLPRGVEIVPDGDHPLHSGRGALLQVNGTDSFYGADSVYAFETTGGLVCVTSYNEYRGPGGGGCGLRQDIGKGIVSGTSSSYPPYNTVADLIEIVLPDGYTMARLGDQVGEVRNNFVEFHGPFPLAGTDRVAVANGPDVRPMTVDLRDMLGAMLDQPN